MFVDARTIPNGVLTEANPCVAGVGSAGIALTREFIGPDARALPLESGGTGPGSIHLPERSHQPPAMRSSSTTSSVDAGRQLGPKEEAGAGLAKMASR